jgi:hypothetical protein
VDLPCLPQTIRKQRMPLSLEDKAPLPNITVWYHQESNRGHKDFQSFALPTELWHLKRFAGAKVGVFYHSDKFLVTFLSKNDCV